MKKENPNTPGKYRKLYIGLSIGAGALLVALVLFVLVFNKFSLRLELHGPEKMTIRYGESYEEMGATPLFSGTGSLHRSPRAGRTDSILGLPGSRSSL